MLRPRVTFSRKGMTSSMPSGPPNERTSSASYAREVLSKSGAPARLPPRIVIEVSTLAYVADVETGKFFIDCHQHAMVAIAFASSGRRFKELTDDVGDGNRRRILGGGGTCNAEILPMQIDAESWFELMGDHGLTLQLEHPAGGEPAGEHLHDLVRVDAGLRAEHQRLADSGVVDGHHDLIAGLHDLTGARPANVDDGLTHRLEEWQRSVEVFGVATNHDAEGARDGALVTAADRRVERPCAPLAQRGINL